MEIYTTKLKPNQIFKNYKELCNFLNEPVKTGKSKQLQLKEWERYFSYKKDGIKFIIIEVCDSPQEKLIKTGGNYKNVKPMMEYIMYCLKTDYLNKYYAISTWSTYILHLLDKNMCDIIYRDDDTVAEYCKEKHLPDQKLFREYVSTVKFVTKSLITTAFRCLERNHLIEYQQGYTFYYEGVDYKNTVSTNVLNEYIDNMEREICQKIKDEHFPDKNIKGKQLIYILHHSNNKELLQLYNDMRMQCMNDNNDVLCELNDAIWDKDADSPDYLDGENKRLLSYYKAYQITAFDDGYGKCNNRQEVVDKIIEMSIKRITGIKYKLSYGEEYHPYDNKESLLEIEKINEILFMNTNRKVTSITQDETQILEDCKEENFEYEGFDFEEIDEMFPIAS